MRRAWLTVSLALAATISVAVGRASAEDFQIVVHPSVKGSGIPRGVVAAIFLGTVARWSDNTQVMPVDQSYRTPVRRAFVPQVLGQSLGELQQYWNRMTTNRRILPPPVKSSDEDVLAFVASNPGAIGYVSAAASVPPGVKKILLLD